jgi:hypothetical protein
MSGRRLFKNNRFYHFCGVQVFYIILLNGKIDILDLKLRKRDYFRWPFQNLGYYRLRVKVIVGVQVYKQLKGFESRFFDSGGSSAYVTGVWLTWTM